jgi:hypothetical protein
MFSYPGKENPMSRISLILPGLLISALLSGGCGGRAVLVPSGTFSHPTDRSPALAVLRRFWLTEATGDALIVANGFPDRPATELLRLRWQRGQVWCGDAPLTPPPAGREPRTWREWLALATPQGLVQQTARAPSRWDGHRLTIEGSPRIVATFRENLPVATRLQHGEIACSVAVLAWS